MMFGALLKRKLRDAFAEQLFIFWSMFLAYSILDAIFVFSWEFWLFAGVAFLFIAPAHSVWAFGGDLRKDYYRFLEYLPIRPSAMWFSNYVSGIIFMTLCFLMLIWHKMIWFNHPEGPAVILYFFRTRWEVLWGGWAFCFFAYSFFINFFPIEKQPPVHAMGLFIPVILYFYFAIGFRESYIIPRPLNLAPVLLVSGALFSLASYVQFTRIPRHSPQKVRFLVFVALPLLIAFSLLSTAIFYWGLHLWKNIEKNEALLIRSAAAVSAKDGAPFISARVSSYRSGLHHLIINPKTGTWHDFGRGYSHLPNAHEKHPNPRLYFVSSLAPKELLPDKPYLVSADISDQKPRRLFPLPKDYNANCLRVASDNSRLIIPETRDGITNLLITDMSGNILQKYGCRSSWQLFLGMNDMLLAMAPEIVTYTEGGARREQMDDNPYLLINVKSLESRRFALPGVPLSFSPGLDAAVCLCRRIDGERFLQSIRYVEIPSFKERILLEEEDLPALPITTQIRDMEYPFIGVEKSFNPYGFTNKDLVFICSNAFNKAVWMKKRVVNEQFLHSLIIVDLQTGEKRDVVLESEIPPMPVISKDSRNVPPVTAFGFTSDDDGIIYRVREKLFCRDLTSSRTTALINKIEPERFPSSPYYQMAFSPSCRRVLQYMPTASYFQGSPPKPPSNSVIFVRENGDARMIWSSMESLDTVWWLDENRIVIQIVPGMYIVNADGSRLRKIL